jgi:hypothetical protein
MVAAADARGGSKMAIRPRSRSPRSISAADGGPGWSAAATARTRNTVPGELLGAGDRLLPGGGVAGYHLRHQHGFWRALADDPHASAGQLVPGGHPLAAAVKRHLGDAFVTSTPAQGEPGRLVPS